MASVEGRHRALELRSRRCRRRHHRAPLTWHDFPIMRASATTVSSCASLMPQANRSCRSVAAGWSGCSACDKAICNKEKQNFTRSFAARAAFRRVTGCKSFSPIAARIWFFMPALGIGLRNTMQVGVCGHTRGRKYTRPDQALADPIEHNISDYSCFACNY